MSSIAPTSVHPATPAAQAKPAVPQKTSTAVQSNTSKAAPSHRQHAPHSVDLTV
jgi:hypothetical protein